MRIVLHDYLETPDGLEVGEVVGELLIALDGVEVLLADDTRRGRVEELLSGPLQQRVGDASGATYTTRIRSLALDDPAFIPALLDRLEHRDLRLHGEVVEG